MLHHLGLGGIDGERQHVGRAGLAHVAVVELGHLAFADEQHGQLGEPAHALGEQHVEGQLLPAGEVDREVALLVGAEHLGHTVAADTLLTCQPRSTVVAHEPAALRSSARP